MRAINWNGEGTLYGNLTSWSVYRLEGVNLTEIQMVGFGENLYIPLDKISAFRRKWEHRTTESFEPVWKMENKGWPTMPLKDYDKRRLCINNWFCTQKTKFGIWQTTWIQRVVEAFASACSSASFFSKSLRKFPTICMPFSVRILSGWNWTPCISQPKVWIFREKNQQHQAVKYGIFMNHRQCPLAFGNFFADTNYVEVTN